MALQVIIGSTYPQWVDKEEVSFDCDTPSGRSYILCKSIALS